MRRHPSSRILALTLGCLGLALAAAAPPARADLTVYCRYELINGDTLSRATYYTASHMRATMSDGNEAIYDASAKEITFINHARKRYWKGPLSRANAIVDSLTRERDQEFWEAAQAQQAEWVAFVERFNKSIASKPVEKTRKIVGKSCVGVEISAGRSMVHTRWIAPDLKVPEYTQEIEKIIILPILDPVGRSMVKLILNAQHTEGVTLAASTRFETPKQKGSFSWEAYRLDTKIIPQSVWAIPEGYEAITF